MAAQRAVGYTFVDSYRGNLALPSTREGLAGHIVRSLRDLTRPREAERFATRSIEVCHPQHRRPRMQRYAILATTHVQQGDLEGACAVGRQVLRRHAGRIRRGRWMT